MTLQEAIAYFEASTEGGYCGMGESCPDCNANLWALRALQELAKRGAAI